MQFVFTTCQHGAESALKKEIHREIPDLVFAYSRPGFVTFKNQGPDLHIDFTLRSVFARAYGISLGKGKSAHEILAFLPKDLGPAHLHVWERDEHAPGEEPLGYEPGARAVEMEKALRIEAGQKQYRQHSRLEPGDPVIDVIWIDPDHWWVGVHAHGPEHSEFPGGRIPVSMPENSPSRAYLKLEEAILWSGAPVRSGDTAVEIGSAPGGASLALLNRGVKVIGIDPAAMAPVVAKHPGFVHIPKAIGAVLREDLPTEVNWLLLDMNVRPDIALAALERLAVRMGEGFLGVLFTLKLNQWKLAGQIPQWLAQVKGLGLSRVKATQLYTNRQEIFVLGLTHRGSLRR